jgi:Ribosomally synthesized peptide prototyped by Frankia Franean1_4349.
MSEEQTVSVKPNEAVIGRAITDPDFRRALVEDPEQALKDAGIQLGPEDLQRLTSMNKEEREQMAEQLDARQSASGMLAYLDNRGDITIA